MTNDELRQEFDEKNRHACAELKAAVSDYQVYIAKGKEQPCPYVVNSSEGTSYCALAEKRTISFDQLQSAGEAVWRILDPEDKIGGCGVMPFRFVEAAKAALATLGIKVEEV